MPARPHPRSDRLARHAAAAGVGLALAALALLLPTPRTADHVLLAAPGQAAAIWGGDAAPPPADMAPRAADRSGT